MPLMNGSMPAHSLTGRARLWLVITSVSILTTLLVGYTLTNPPRSWMTWCVLVFVCFVQFTFGTIAAETSRLDAAHEMTSAMASVILGGAGLFGFIGFATILISLVFAKQSTNRDALVVSLLVVETVVFLIGVTLLRHTDRAIGETDKASIESDRALVNKSTRILEVVQALRALKPARVDQSIQIESLVKSLESCASLLSHLHRTLPDTDNSLSSALSELEAIGTAIAQNGLNQLSLEKLEKVEKDLQSVVRRLAAP